MCICPVRRFVKHLAPEKIAPLRANVQHGFVREICVASTVLWHPGTLLSGESRHGQQCMLLLQQRPTAFRFGGRALCRMNWCDLDINEVDQHTEIEGQVLLKSNSFCLAILSHFSVSWSSAKSTAREKESSTCAVVRAKIERPLKVNDVLFEHLKPGALTTPQTMKKRHPSKQSRHVARRTFSKSWQPCRLFCPC